jgi:translocation and assembly module TamA
MRHAVFTASLVIFASLAGAEDRTPCASVVFTGAPAIELTAVERTLVCGDPRTEGWESVPVGQAKYFLRAFLQKRGYQDPHFVVAHGRLEVDVGRRSFIRSLRVEGLPPGIDASKLRKISGKTLTPAALDSIELSLVSALQNAGFPCPKVRLSADSVTGAVEARASPGAPGTFATISPAPLKGSDPAVFRRYEAFRWGQAFDMRLLLLTAQRSIADSAFVSAYYDVLCSTGAVRIEQRVTEGKSRLYKIGVGFDTEGYAIGKTQWKNARIDSRGSSIEGAIYGSFRQQSVELSLHESPIAASRFYFKPRLSYDRENQLEFESINAEASVLPGGSWDGDGLRGDFALGPALESIRTVRGPGADKDTFLAFKTQSSVMDHEFEYYAGEPRSGARVSLDTISRIAGAESSFSAHRISVKGEALWNLGNFNPPLLIAATRWWAGTTLVGNREAALRALGPEMRFFLGGDANLRGAALMGLPGDDVGFLSAVYDGVELRLGDVVPHGFQPLIFMDGAMGGRADAHLDPDVYWSPGVGFRWALPVGSIRGTAARGLTWRRDHAAPTLYRPHWQLFLSFGQEF